MPAASRVLRGKGVAEAQRPYPHSEREREISSETKLCGVTERQPIQARWGSSSEACGRSRAAQSSGSRARTGTAKVIAKQSAFACRITFAVEGEIFVNSGLTYRFFDFEVVDAVFALDGES